MAQRQQIIIHAGFHRCASTATQNLLRRNRAAIEASGVKLLLREDLEGLLSGRQLRLLYRHQDQSMICRLRLWLVKRMLRRLRAKYILVSEELLLGLMPGVRDRGFYPHFGNFLAAIKALAEDFDIQLKFIVRRQDRFLESAYAFRVPRGTKVPFKEYVNRIGLGNVSWLSLVRQVEAAGLADQTSFTTIEGLPKGGEGNWILHFLEVGYGAQGPQRLSGNRRKPKAELAALAGTQDLGFTESDRAAFLAQHKADNDAFLAHPVICAPPSTWD